MKIATWNLERPSHTSKARNTKILDSLKKIDADILILTETNSIIHPVDEFNSYATASLKISDEHYYKEGENRTTIWSKYPAHKQIKTYDALTSICISIMTPLGSLNVYGTIIGIHGNRRESFNADLEKQLADWRSICEMGNICLAGDFNVPFSDNYYYTN